MKMLKLLSIFICLAVFTPVHAQDEKSDNAVKAEEQTQDETTEGQSAEAPAGLYSPDFCEFGITFPEKPYATRQCEDAAKTKCFDQVSYTHVYEMASTINFRVICNPVSADTAKAFDEKIMLSTLRAMAKDSGADEFNADARTEEAGYKQGGLAGMGTVGQNHMIYVGQLWVGEQSILSVEGELIGDTFEEADRKFSDILKSVEFTGKKEIIPPEKTEAPEKQ